MLRTILAVGFVILAVMVAVRDGRVLRFAGLTGSCAAYGTAADGTQMEACRPGRLEGAPDLSGHGCTATGAAGPVEYWRCPAALAATAGN